MVNFELVINPGKEYFDELIAMVALDSQNNVVGYARLSGLLNNKAGSIGPFYSDSNKIAEVLLARLLDDSSIYEAWETLNPRIISSNGRALELFRKASNDKIKLECSMHSQFTKELLPVPEEKVYGFFECGLSYI
uniref:Acetyltransf_18 domain-containing protein n=1 Tax=Bursaphelenchus xylophilus TaxID=6326 RepID=A0A1I7S0U2_BURXY